MMSYSELRRKILSLLSQPPYRYNIPYLARLFGVHRTVIHKVIKPLEKKGLVTREKYDGMTWISLHHKTLYNYLRRKVDFAARKRSEVDLIKNKRVSQTPLRNCEKDHGKIITASTTRCGILGGPVHNCCVGSSAATPQLRFPKRAHWARLRAWRFLFGKSQLTLDDYAIVNELFNAYLVDTGQRVIVLVNDDGRTLWIGYRHRFSRNGIKRLLRKFHAVFDKTNKYHVGVWLTLTVDPKRYRNLIEMRYELQKAWNRFMSWLKKKLGKRPQYIRVIEFTKSGLVHYHVLLLGIARIGDKKKIITPELERIGFGKINFMYTIVNRSGIWIPKKLFKTMKADEEIKKDGAGLPLNLRSYIKKYLVKAFQDLDIENLQVETRKINPITLYWALNSRFFTYSKQLRPEPETTTTSKIIINGKETGYKFLGTGYIVSPEILPLETDDPPWNYHVPLTFPPLYDPGLVL